MRQKETELGLTERIIMAMAGEMAAARLNTERACVLFQALAKSVGVNVATAFENAAMD